MSSNEESLGLLYTAFVKAPEAQKYHLFQKLRQHLNKNPELREVDQGHPLWIEAIDWHISVLTAEREALLDLLEARKDHLQTYGFGQAPEACLYGWDNFNDCLMVRIQQLKKAINEAKVEKNQRIAGVYLQMKRAAA